MFMDNHGSHCTHEFIALVNRNHIRCYPLIPHITHCMQPLDVRISQPYKHQHDVVIQDTLLEFNIGYILPRFLGDPTKLWDNTFTETTIRHAFKQPGMWPPNVTKCIGQLKSFNPDIQKTTVAGDGPPLSTRTFTSLHRTQSATPIDVESGLQEWGEKIYEGMVWSDPIRPEELTLPLKVHGPSVHKLYSMRFSCQSIQKR